MKNIIIFYLMLLVSTIAEMPETEIWKMPFESIMADTETPEPEMCAGEEEAKAQEQRQCANSHQAGEYL